VKNRARPAAQPGDAQPPTTSTRVRDLVSLLLVRNDVKGAREILNRFIAADPRDENRYRMAAALLASRNMADVAAQVYRQGRQAIGSETLFAAELAQLEADRGEYAAAIGEYLLLAGDPQRRQRVWREISSLLDRAPDADAVVEKIEAMRKSHPKSPAIQDVAAMAALQMERYPQALAAIREADRWAGDQGEYLLEFGRIALEGAAPDSLPPARLHAGIDALQELAERHPQSGLLPEATQMAAAGLVAVARRMPDGEERRTLLRQAVQFIDANAKRLGESQLANRSLALKGMILFEDLGQPKEALAVFESVAASQRALGEPDQLLQVQMALCHAALGDLDQARAALEKLVETDSLESRSRAASGVRTSRSTSLVAGALLSRRDGAARWPLRQGARRLRGAGRGSARGPARERLSRSGADAQ
jgi:tetratricopeptide (TPR) repeat protein